MSKKTILIVEDVPEVARLYEFVLSPSFDIEKVITVIDGLSRLDREPKVDLVILDLILPDKSGVGVLQDFLRKHQEVPIVVITGGCYDETDILLHGAQEFLNKPVDNKALMNAVLRAIARHRVRKVFQPIKEAIREAKAELVSQDARLERAIKDDDGTATNPSGEK